MGSAYGQLEQRMFAGLDGAELECALAVLERIAANLSEYKED